MGQSPAHPNSSTQTTASEAYLTRLCRRAFLHLWSYPNLFRDQGKQGCGDGKELCDLLVVFGDDVLIFSDKHCIFRDDRPVEVAWRRWWRDAVLNSARQIAGAERWLLSHPDRVFTDGRCHEPLPIPLPATPRIHRVVTCRGAAAGSRKHWNGGTGSLLVTNRPLKECSDRPFHVGCFDDGGKMIHVFDEVALDEVLSTLDTITDFCRYLQRREEFFRRVSFISAPGEEDLVAFYLRNIVPGSAEHDFIVEDGLEGVALDASFGEWWANSEERAARVAADRISYCWDRLIEKFTHHMIAGTQHFTTDGGVRRSENLVRWMAREDRVRRRMLARVLIDAMETTQTPGRVRRSLILPMRPGDPHWVFLVLPRPDGMAYETYREVRREFLLNHCAVVKLLHPDAEFVTGIAVEPRVEEISEDAVCMDVRTWSPEDNERAREAHLKLGIFTSPTRNERHEWEFPPSDGGAAS